MSILANSNAIESGGYNITRSLRFRKSATANLTRTFASAGNRKTWTYSAWVKLGSLAGPSMSIFSANASASTISFDDQGGYYTIAVDGVYNGTRHLRYTSSFYRDPSAWYHVVVALDTTQATDTNRIKLYVNGSQISLANAAVGSWPAQNSDGNIDNNIQHCIGQRIFTTDYNLDGYLTEVNFIDGQALTPSSFGSTNAETGVWQPSKYTGTYGTNGFYLPFTDTSSTTNLVKDSSGNGNNWTPNNISLTSGTTYDSMTDVPTLTSATAANYAVMNPLDWYGATASGTLTNGNLTWTTNTAVGSGNTNLNRGSIGFPSTGKYYVEFVASTVNISNTGYATIQIDWASGVSNAYLWWQYASPFYQIYNNSTYATIPTIASGDIIQLAIDMDAGKAWFGQNNTWLLSGNPATGTPMSTAITFTANTADMKLQFNGRTGSAANVINANFGQRGFSYTPPTGYVALNTYNLPTSTIVKGNKYMDASLWTGDGNASQNVVNSGSMQPDFLWAKCRSTAGTNNVLIDSVRGTNVWLASDSQAAEASGTLSTFLSNGISPTNSGLNTSTRTYVGWQWQAGQGTTSTNTSGSITSTVSVNTTAGFSVVTYTGNGTTATIGHSLGVAPRMIIVKKRNAVANWSVYHASVGATQVCELNTTNAFSASGQWGNTSPTSTVFTHSADNAINWVAYCWAAIPGYSAFTSYTGNGSTDGPFIYLGFRPKFVMIKSSSAGGAGYNWTLYDTSRNTYNVSDLQLNANLSDAEAVSNQMDILSNGIKIFGSGTRHNGSGTTYIVAAFAENPFKNSLAR